MIHEHYIYDSSMISKIEWDDKTLELRISFTDKYFIKNPQVFLEVPVNIYERFIEAESVGKYYNNTIKKLFKQSNKKPSIMAENQEKKKIPGMNKASSKKRFINMSLDLSKVKKEWLVSGKENAIWLNVCLHLLPDGTVDRFDNLGMVTQVVPKEVYEKNKEEKGPILGNGKENDWEAARGSAPASNPGEGASFDSLSPEKQQEIMDDLPF